MRLLVPENPTLEGLAEFWRSAEFDDIDRLLLDLPGGLEQVHPSIAAVVACRSHDVLTSGGTVEVVLRGPVGPGVRRCDIGAWALDDRIRADIDDEPAGRIVPVTGLRTEEEVRHLLVEVTPVLHAENEVAKGLQYVLGELVRNVLEHSRSPFGGFVSASFDPDSGCISVGVADAGVGVHATLPGAESPMDAIHLALRPGVTGATPRIGGNDTNGGLGLFFSKAIASASGRGFVVMTGDSLFALEAGEAPTIEADAEKDQALRLLREDEFLGTAVGLDFTIRSEGTFVDVLSQVGAISAQDIREQRRQAKKRKYRKIRFE